jgi:hypothetical protein
MSITSESDAQARLASPSLIEAGAEAEELGPKERFEAEVKKLASLSDIEYNVERKNAAKSLRVTVTFLDRLVRSARNVNVADTGQGRAISLPDPEPWPYPVEGAELLNDIAAAICRYVVVPLHVADAIALWVVHCYGYEVFICTPRLAITSPEKQCGKTTLLDVLGCLVPRPLPAANITASAVFRTVEIAKPTILIDEADTFLEGNDELRGILDSGHRINGNVIRVVGDHHEPRQFSTHSPAAIAMIGKLPPTLADRSIAVALRRRLPNETVNPFRMHKIDDLKQLSRKAARWARDNVESLQRLDPTLPDRLFNRQADNWGPLFAIADIAGGDWPDRIKGAAELIEFGQSADEQSVGEQLLADLRDIFDETALTRMPSQDLVSRLVSNEGRPWAEWSYGKPMTVNQLARALRPFGIFPTNIRLPSGKILKGYYREHLNDSIARYLPNQTAPPPNVEHERAEVFADDLTQPLAPLHRYNQAAATVYDENDSATPALRSGSDRYDIANQAERSGTERDVADDNLEPLQKNANDLKEVAAVAPCAVNIGLCVNTSEPNGHADSLDVTADDDLVAPGDGNDLLPHQVREI